VLFQTTEFSSAFQFQRRTHAHKPRILFSTAIETLTKEAEQPEQPRNSLKPCFYKRVDGNWRTRKQLNQLFIGQRLLATRLSECDLINGVTGPKAFLECGVGRVTGAKGEWKIVNGMLRLGKRTGSKNRMKESVVRKKLAKLPDDSLFAVYVSMINLDHASFEVSLNKNDALEEGQRSRPVSASTLSPGQELSGYVKDVHPYGVFIDVGANRKGLLHITKVAQHYDSYIDKEEGLKKFGLKPGASVNVVVVRNGKKRLEFGFPSTVDIATKEDPDVLSYTQAPVDLDDTDEAADITDIDEEEAAMWAAYADYNSYSNDEVDEDDKHDEDKEIEDALGIGSW